MAREKSLTDLWHLETTEFGMIETCAAHLRVQWLEISSDSLQLESTVDRAPE